MNRPKQLMRGCDEAVVPALVTQQGMKRQRMAGQDKLLEGGKQPETGIWALARGSSHKITRRNNLERTGRTEREAFPRTSTNLGNEKACESVRC